MNSFHLLAATSLTSLLAAQTNAPLPAPQSVLDHFGVSQATIQHVDVPNVRETFRFDVVLGSGTTYTVELTPNDIRSASFRLLVDDGIALRQLPTPASVTWRGRVLGQPDSAVAGSIVNGRLDAMIAMGAENGIWSIQSTRAVDANRPVTEHAVFTTVHDIHKDARCGLTTNVKQTQHKGPGFDMSKIAEIALDCDLDYYQRNNSDVGQTQATATTIVNGVGSIYLRDVDIDYEITTILVRTTRTYTTSDMGSLLRQFQSRWNNNHRNVQRDVAHLFTGKGTFSGVIGVAYLGVICSRNSGYGVDKAYSSLGSSVGLVAHELGHNWNAPHCDSSNPCRIMCSGLGGCAGNVSGFGPASISVISGFRDSRSCLSDSLPPTLTDVSPRSVTVFRPSRVRLTGTELRRTSAISLGSQTITNFTVESDTEVSFIPPTPTATGTLPISLTTPHGTTSSLSLSYRLTRPAKFLSPDFGFSGVPLNFAFGGDRDDQWFVIVSFDNNTFQFMNRPILLNNLTLGQGSLDGLGIGGFVFPVPNVSLSGLTMYSQMIAIQNGSLQVNDITDINQTRFF